MGFDPKSYQPQKEQRDADVGGEPLKSGVYDLIAVWWKRISPRAVKVCWKAIHGPSKGRSAFILHGIDTSKPANADRWYYLCLAAGIEDPLTFSDNDFDNLILGSALRAKIITKKKGDYTDSDFIRVFPRTELSRGDIAVLDNASTEYDEKRAEARERREAQSGRNDDWGDDAPHPGDRDSRDEPEDRGDAPADDDIPF